MYVVNTYAFGLRVHVYQTRRLCGHCSFPLNAWKNLRIVITCFVQSLSVVRPDGPRQRCWGEWISGVKKLVPHLWLIDRSNTGCFYYKCIFFSNGGWAPKAQSRISKQSIENRFRPCNKYICKYICMFSRFYRDLEHLQIRKRYHYGRVVDNSLHRHDLGHCINPFHVLSLLAVRSCHLVPGKGSLSPGMDRYNSDIFVCFILCWCKWDPTKKVPELQRRPIDVQKRCAIARVDIPTSL